MIYLRADENEAGVTVEEAPRLAGKPLVRIDGLSQEGTVMILDVEARAVVEGLLRRMLERDEHRTVEWFGEIVTRRGEGR